VWLLDSPFSALHVSAVECNPQGLPEVHGQALGSWPESLGFTCRQEMTSVGDNSFQAYL
jgi:hypothetical protein